MSDAEDSVREEDSEPEPSTSSSTTKEKDKDGKDCGSGAKVIKKGDRLIKEYVDVKTGKIAVYEPGIKLEVSDFKGTWYPAKVLEVDYDENEVLIHYDKWSPRFDEWIKTDSNRLRPSSDTNVVKIQFKVGERVEALWSTDGRKYPGTIKANLPNDYYEVLFDDGIKCKKKVSQIFKLQRITRGKAAAASASIAKENEKKPQKSSRSLSSTPPATSTSASASTATILYPAKSALLDLSPSPCISGSGASQLISTRKRRSRDFSSGTTSSDKFDQDGSSVESVMVPNSDATIQKETVKSLSFSGPGDAAAGTNVPSSSQPGSAAGSLHHHSIFDPITTDLGKRKRASHDYSLFLKIPKKPQIPKAQDTSEGTPAVRRRARRSRTTFTEDETSAVEEEKETTGEADLDVDADIDNGGDRDHEYNECSDVHDDDTPSLLSPSSVSGMPLKRIRKSSMKAIENIAASPAPGERSPKRRLSRRGSILPSESHQLLSPTRNLHEMESSSELSQPQHQQVSLTNEIPASPMITEPEPPAGFVDEQGNTVTVDQTEDGGWICPIENCGKHFRKDSLLQMHLKHYHPTSKIHLQGNKLNRFEITIARARGSRSRNSNIESTSGSTSFSISDHPHHSQHVSDIPLKRRRRASGLSTTAAIAAAVAAAESQDSLSTYEDDGDSVILEDVVLTADSVELATPAPKSGSRARSASMSASKSKSRTKTILKSKASLPAEPSEPAKDSLHLESELVADDVFNIETIESVNEDTKPEQEASDFKSKSSSSRSSKGKGRNKDKEKDKSKTDVNTSVCVLLEKINMNKVAANETPSGSGSGPSGSRRTGSHSGSRVTRVSQRGRILAPKKWNRIYSDTESDEDDELLDLTDSSEEEDSKSVSKSTSKSQPVEVEVPIQTPSSSSTSSTTSRKFRSQNQNQSQNQKEKRAGGKRGDKSEKSVALRKPKLSQSQNQEGQIDHLSLSLDLGEDDRLIEEGEVVVAHIPGSNNSNSKPSRSHSSPQPLTSASQPQLSTPSLPPTSSSTSTSTSQSHGQSQSKSRGSNNKMSFKLSRGSRDKNFMSNLTAKKLNLISQELIALGVKKKLTAAPKFEDVKVDIINCECGIQEEFGLMMQCELCQAWQHGNCYEIFEVSQLPQYYVCSFCREPKNLRNSMQNEWYQEVNTTGRLPRFSFGPPNDPEQEDRMRGSNDLFNSLTNIQSLLRSTQMKITMLNSRKDHPKLVLWSQEQKPPAVVARREDFKSNFRSVLRQLLRYHCRDHAYIFRLRRKVEMKIRSPNEDQVKIQKNLKSRFNTRAWQMLNREKRLQKILKKQKRKQPRNVVMDQNQATYISHPVENQQSEAKPQPLISSETSNPSNQISNAKPLELSEAVSDIVSEPITESTVTVVSDTKPQDQTVETEFKLEDHIHKIKSELQLKSKEKKCIPVFHSKSEGKQFLLLTKTSDGRKEPSALPDSQPSNLNSNSKEPEPTGSKKGKLRRLTQTIELPDGSYTKKVIGFGRVVDGLDGVKVVQLLTSQATGGQDSTLASRHRRKRSGADDNICNNNVSAGNKKLVSVDSLSKLGMCKTCKHSFQMEWKPKDFIKEENIHLIKTTCTSVKPLASATATARSEQEQNLQLQLQQESPMNSKLDEESNSKNLSMNIPMIGNQSQVDLDLTLAALTEDLCGTEAGSDDMGDMGMGLGINFGLGLSSMDPDPDPGITFNNVQGLDNNFSAHDNGNSNGNSESDISIPSSFLNGTGGEIKSLKNLCEEIVGKDNGELLHLNRSSDSIDIDSTLDDKMDIGSMSTLSGDSVIMSSFDQDPDQSITNSMSVSTPTATTDSDLQSKLNVEKDVKPEIIVEETKRKRSMDGGITIPKKITGKSCRVNLHAAIVREQALLDLHLDTIENKLKELETTRLGDPHSLLNKLKDLEELKKKVQLINDKIDFMRNVRPDPSSPVDTSAAVASAASIVSVPISVPAE